MTTRVIRVDFLNEKVDRSFVLGKISGIIAVLNEGDRNFSLHGNTKYPDSYVLLIKANDEDYEKIKEVFSREFGHIKNITITVYEKKNES